ncbi:MAG: flippase-like domain-containing protein [Arcicella sp.]|nr:flippase-like domain-containing protein [Arcicella sp.]
MQFISKTIGLLNYKFSTFWIIFKWLIFCTVIYFLYSVIRNRQVDIGYVIYHLNRVLSVRNIFFFLIVFLLSFLNWSLEAKKWQILVNQVEIVSFKDAFKSVLIGLSFGFISQADLGDLAGKMVLIKNENRKKSTGAVLLGGGIQTYISLIFGTFGLTYFMINVFSSISTFEFAILNLCFLGIFSGIVLLYYRKNINFVFDNFSFLAYLKPFLIILESYSNLEIIQVFTLSVSRYLIFSLQFLIILFIFQIDLPILVLMMIIFLVFLVKTIVPSVSFLSDLGIRSMTSLYLFEFYKIKSSIVIASTFTIWFINILLPVIIGTFVFLRLKKTQKKSIEDV